MAKEFSVHRKGYERKGFRACRKSTHGITCYHVTRTHVPATSFTEHPRAHTLRARGKHPKKYIHIKHKGELGGKGFFSRPASQRRKVYKALAKRKGEKHVVGALRAIQVYNENVNPSLAEKARADSHWVAGEFKGKKDVGYPSGFRRKKLREMA